MNTKKAMMQTANYWRELLAKNPENKGFRTCFLIARNQYKAFHAQSFNNTIQILLPYA